MATRLFGKTNILDENISYSSVIRAITDAIKICGVKVVYNYPGRPAGLLIEKIKSDVPDVDVQDYLPNEFVATAKGFGSSVAGCERSLVVFKDVGTNVACDHFYCLNHIGINRGLVFFVSDDPSAWYSQNEEDSRGLYFSAGLPILEPYDPYSAYYSVITAFELSEKFKLPFFIRTTGRALKEVFNSSKDDFVDIKIPFSENFIDIPFDATNRWKSIFGTVEEDRYELLQKQKNIADVFDNLGINTVTDNSKLGVIASGFPAKQLEIENLTEGISLLKLVSIFPLPEKIIYDFIKDKERILVIDQGEPFLEMLIRDCAQRHSYNKPILGKLNGFVARVGEFRDDDLRLSVNAFKNNLPVVSFPLHRQIAKAPAYKENDGYRILLNTLRDAVRTVRCRPLYCGDAGQPSQIPDTPGFEDMLHMETTMGCSISYLSGGIESYKRAGLSVPFKGIAYVGDSDFFHSALPGICEAVAKDHPILMILVDNQGAVSTGKQSHLGMKINNQIKELSIKKILSALGVSLLEEALVSDEKDLKEKLIKGLKYDRFATIIVHTE